MAKWRGRRPKENYRGYRRNAMRKAKNQMARKVRNDRWKTMMGTL